MNRKIKIIIAISSSVVLLLSTFLAVYFTVISPPRLTEFDNIVIWNDSDFRNYKFEGKGTETEPYLITNYEISTSIARGIFIADTTKHFIIEGCDIEAPYAGIYIQNTAENTAHISNNIVKNGKIGIFVSNSDGAYIINNTCENIDGQNGISIHHSNEMKLINNTINSVEGKNEFSENANFGNGILIANCPDSQILRNQVSENDGNGISLSYSPNCTIEQNNLNQNILTGLYIWDSANAVIRNNEIIGSGIVFDTYNRYTFGVNVIPLEYYESFIVDESNIVNGKPLGYYVDYHNQVINTDLHDQYIFIKSSNLTISGLDITDSTGLAFYYCENLYILDNNIINSAECGINIFYSDNTTIENNICNFNEIGGIEFLYSNNSLCKNNTFNYNSRVGLSNDYSFNNSHIENQCNYNGNIGSSIAWSTQIDIQRNNYSNNIMTGIDLTECTDITVNNNTMMNNQYGVSLYDSETCIIVNNTVSQNSLGIILFGRIAFGFTNFTTITYNSISDNTQYGVVIYAGYQNKVHHNSFINNNLVGTSQGFDSGTNNIWYDILSSEGNHWSDWISGPYTISGSAGSEDLYPLAAPPV